MGWDIEIVILQHKLFGFVDFHRAAVDAGERGIAIRGVVKGNAEIELLEDGVDDPRLVGVDEQDVVESKRALVAVQRGMVAGVGFAVGSGGNEEAVVLPERMRICGDEVVLQRADARIASNTNRRGL